MAIRIDGVKLGASTRLIPLRFACHQHPQQREKLRGQLNFVDDDLSSQTFETKEVSSNEPTFVARRQQYLAALRTAGLPQ